MIIVDVTKYDYFIIIVATNVLQILYTAALQTRRMFLNSAPRKASTIRPVNSCAPAKAEDDARLPLRIGKRLQSARIRPDVGRAVVFMPVKMYVDESDGRRKGAPRYASGRMMDVSKV